MKKINFKVHVLGRPGLARGIYLRQPEETLVKQTFSVEIDPIFGTEDNADEELQKQRIDFEMKTALEASESWVEVPDYFMLMHNGRTFKFTVDPTNLAPGVHTANIYGYDVNNRDIGPRFSVPITIVKPLERSTTVSLGELEFDANEVKRFFLDVPEGASWMDVTVKDGRDQSVDKETSSRLIVLHTIQLLPHNAYRDAETQKYLNLLPAQETVTSIPIHSGVTCELDLARYWSAQGPTKVNVEITFRGVTASPDELTLVAGGDGARTRLLSTLGNQGIKPEAKLTKWKTPLSPKDSVISPCDERDVIPSTNKQIHQLVLTYEFEQKEEGSFTPKAPGLQGYIYESAFESQLMLIFDEDKKYLGVADSWPDEVKAPKGKVTIRLQVRHDDVKKLEMLKDSMLWIERRLKSNIALSSYASHANMVTDGPKLRKRTLRKGTTSAVFFKEPAASNLPSDCKSGDVLTGTATFEDDGGNLSGLGKKPDGTKVTFVVGSKVESKDKEDKVKTPELDDNRDVEEKMHEELRTAEVNQLKKWSDKDDDVKKFEAYYEKLIEKDPDHVPLLMVRLKFDDKKEKSEEKLQLFVDSADSIIDKLDEKKIAAHFGMNHDDEDAESVKVRRRFFFFACLVCFFLSNVE